MSDFFEELRKQGKAHIEDGADQVVKTGLAGWWAKTDSNQRYAVAGLCVAAALGPLGQGFLGALGVLFDKAALPSSKQVEAVGYLFLITAPVALTILVVAFFVERLTSGWLLAAAVAAAVVGAGIAGTAPTQLGDLYCYAEAHGLEVVYEKECRAFDTRGFATEINRVGGSPKARGLQIIGWAFIFTEEARGDVMVLASGLGAFCLGYLARRQTEAA